MTISVKRKNWVREEEGMPLHYMSFTLTMQKCRVHGEKELSGVWGKNDEQGENIM